MAVAVGPRVARAYLVAVLLLAAAASVLSFRSYNELYGGADEGCYTTMGYLLAHGSGFAPSDPVAQRAATYTDPNFFLPDPYGMSERGISTGRIGAPWPKGYPLLTAPGWWLFGYTGHKLWNPLAGGLLLILTFLLLSTMGMPAAGVAAAMLLGTAWVFLWYARYPMSEMTSALLTAFAGFLVARHRARGGYWHLGVAAVVAGYAVWVHVANAVLLPAFVLWLVLTPAAGSAPAYPTRRRCVSVLLLAVLPLLIAGSYPLLDPASYVAAAAQGAAESSETVHRSSAGFFAWEARPFLRDRHLPDASGTPYFAVLNAKLLPWITNWNLLVPVPLTLLSIWGLPLALRDPKWRSVWLGFLLCACSTMFIQAARDVGNPHVLYTARRFLPVILPLACMLAGLTLSSALAGPSRLLRAAAWLLVISLAGIQFSTHAAFLGVETGSSTRRLAVDVRRTVEREGPLDDALVILCSHAGAISAGLRYIEGVPIVNGNRTPPSLVPGIIGHELRAGRRVYLLAESPPPLTLAGDGRRWQQRLERTLVEYDPNVSDTYTYPTLAGGMVSLALYRAVPDRA